VASAEPHRPRGSQSLEFHRRLKFKAGFRRQRDQCFRLGRGDENNRIGIGGRAGFTDDDHREPPDDEITNALLIEECEGEPAEGIETTR